MFHLQTVPESEASAFWASALGWGVCKRLVGWEAEQLMCRKKIVELVLLSQQAGNAPPPQAVFCTNTSWDSTGGRNLHVSPELKSIDREAVYGAAAPCWSHLQHTAWAQSRDCREKNTGKHSKSTHVKEKWIKTSHKKVTIKKIHVAQMSPTNKNPTRRTFGNFLLAFRQ